MTHTNCTHDKSVQLVTDNVTEIVYLCNTCNTEFVELVEL